MKKIINNVYVFSIISKVIGVIGGIVYTILLSRYLGAELRGESVIILNLVSIISVVLGMGVYQAYPRYKKLEGNILEKFLGNITAMFLLYYCISILIVIFIPININAKIAALIIPMTIYIKQLNYIVLVEHPKRRNLASILLNLIDILFVTIAMLTVKSNYFVMVCFLIIKELITLLIALQNLKINIFSIKIRIRELKKYIRYGFIPMLTLLLMTINYRIDVLMLKGQVSISQIGIYSLGVSLSERIWLIPDALKDILISRLSKGKNEYEVAKVIRISLCLCIVSIILVIIFGKPAINLLFGKEFSSSYEITVIMLFGVIGMIFYKIVYSYNVVNGYKTVNLILLGIAAIINIVGNLILIPIMGIKGAALTSVISYLICGILFLIYCKEKTNIKLSELIIVQKDDINLFLKKVQ